MSQSRTPKYNPRVANPWENESRCVTAIRRSLILAEQMGLHSEEYESGCAEELANLNSTKMIDLQKDVSSKTKSLYQLRKDIAAHIREKEAGDFLQIKTIESRINMITQLCTDLDKVMQNTEALVHRLRKPFVGEYIKLEAQYHSEACEVMTSLVPTLNELVQNLDNITWAAKQDFSSSSMKPLMIKIQSLIASSQTSFHNMHTLRRGISDMSSYQAIAAVSVANDTNQNCAEDIG